MTRQPIPMDRDDRIFGAAWIVLDLALGLIGALMAAIGWSDASSVLGVFWGISGVVIVVLAIAVVAWIGRDVVRGEWR